MKKIIAIFVLLILFILFFLYYWKRLYIIQTRANITTIDYDNTYVFCTPSRAKANCEEIIRCTVIVLDTRGLPLENKQCKMNSQNNQDSISFMIAKGLSDSNGACIIDITACNSGQYVVETYLEGKLLESVVKLVFD